jgi:hypothetical protein
MKDGKFGVKIIRPTHPKLLRKVKSAGEARASEFCILTSPECDLAEYRKKNAPSSEAAF